MTADSIHHGTPHRAMITACAIGATVLQLLDQTIANVALPYMQGSFASSFDEITWVLTSYITAAAIMTAPVGWLAARYGRKPLYVGCVFGFTITSMLCGAAQSTGTDRRVPCPPGYFWCRPRAFVTGHSAGHLSCRAAWLRHGDLGRRCDARTDYGADGRWLADRDLQLALGVLHQPAVRAARCIRPNDIPPGWWRARAPAVRLAWIRVLAVGIGGLQLMLDRGHDKDWFTSREIIIEAVFASLGFYLFLVHVLSARQPLIRPALFRDINFASGVLLMFMIGIFMVSSLALMTPWLQIMSHYPVETAGLIMAPRGFGSLVTTLLTGRLANRIDARLLVGIGLLMLTYSYWLMTGWTPDVPQRQIVIAIVIQGAAMGLLFTPIQVLAFVTLAPSMRTEGASLFSLLRNLGAAIGVSVATSVMAGNAQAMHEMIGASLTPFNRALQAVGPVHQWLDPATRHGAALLDRIVNEQAQIIAYADNYVLLMIATVPAWILLLMMRLPPRTISLPAE